MILSWTSGDKRSNSTWSGLPSSSSGRWQQVMLFWLAHVAHTMCFDCVAVWWHIGQTVLVGILALRLDSETKLKDFEKWNGGDTAVFGGELVEFGHPKLHSPKFHKRAPGRTSRTVRRKERKDVKVRISPLSKIFLPPRRAGESFPRGEKEEGYVFCQLLVYVLSCIAHLYIVIAFWHWVRRHLPVDQSSTACWSVCQWKTDQQAVEDWSTGRCRRYARRPQETRAVEGCCSGRCRRYTCWPRKARAAHCVDTCLNSSLPYAKQCGGFLELSPTLVMLVKPTPVFVLIVMEGMHTVFLRTLPDSKCIGIFFQENPTPYSILTHQRMPLWRMFSTSWLQSWLQSWCSHHIASSSLESFPFSIFYSINHKSWFELYDPILNIWR